MFVPSSRYYALKTAIWTAPDGRSLTYVRRRFIPETDAMPTVAKVTVNQGDRLDNLTARTLGDPEQFWYVADTNHALNPNDLTATPGDQLRIAVPFG